MAKNQLINAQCPLEKALLQIVPGSERYADQIQEERLENKETRDQSFIVRDFAMFAYEKGGFNLWLSRINPGFENAAEYCRRLKQPPLYYPVQPNDIKRIKSSKDTIIAPLSKLELIRYNSREFCHFDIPTKDQSSLNDTQRALQERIYPKKILQELKNQRLNTVSFYIPDPAIISKILFSLHADALGVICKLDRLYSYSSFTAMNWDVYYSSALVRGVQRSAECAEREIKSNQILEQKVLTAL